MKKKISTIVLVLLLLLNVTIGDISTVYAVSNTPLENMIPGDRIFFADKEWIILDPSSGYIILASNDGDKPWDTGSGISYKESSLGLYLNGAFLDSLGEDNKNLIQDWTWECGSENNEPVIPYMCKIGLLAYSENQNFGHIVFYEGYDWWLLTPDSNNPGCIWAVSGPIPSHPSFIDKGVRPTLHLESGLFVSAANEIVTYEKTISIDITTQDNKTISNKEGYDTITISGTLQDGVGSDIYYRVDGNEGDTGTNLGINIVMDDEAFNKEVNLGAVSEGVHSLYIWAEKNNEQKTNEICRYFKVDKTKPTASLTWQDQEGHTTGQYKESDLVTIIVEFSEDIKAANEVEIRFTGANTFGPVNMTRVDATHYSYEYIVQAGNGIVDMSLSNGTDLVLNPVQPIPTSGGSFYVDNMAPIALFSGGIDYSIIGNAVLSDAQSNELGDIYLFNEGHQAYPTPTLTEMENAIANNTCTKAAINSIDTNTAITLPSAEGTYRLFSVDQAGNISMPSTNTVTRVNPPSVVYVSTEGNNVNDGSQDNPYLTIQKGINSVVDGGTVYVKAGTYQENLTIAKDLSLIGDGQNNTIIDGTQRGTVIKIPENNKKYEVNITGLTITNGKAPNGGTGGIGGNGGGIYNSGEATITSCSITGNRAGTGGQGAYGHHGGGTGGAGGHGGGIYNSGTLTLTNCSIAGNCAGDGGAGGTADMFGSTGGNGGSGGGIFNTQTATISNCSITDNSAGTGGVGYDGGPDGSDGSGGGLYDAGTATITNCSITANSTDNIPSYTITESDGDTEVLESGTTDSFSIILDSKPDTNVVFNISSKDTGEVVVDKSTVTFSPDTWNIPQTIYVTGIDDSIIDDNQITAIEIKVDASNNIHDYDLLLVTTVDEDKSEIDVKGNNISIIDGDTTPQEEDHTYFGSTNVNNASIVRTFTIENTGSVDLNIDQVVISGINESDFITTQPANPVSPGGITTFTVDFTPSAKGERTAQISIANNDTDENPYNFTIKGRGIGYSILESGGSTQVSESGTTDTFTIVLDAKPNSNVEFSVSSNDTGEAVIDKSMVTFTPDTWDIPQTITVTGIDDNEIDGNQIATITIDINSLNSDDMFDLLQNQIVSVTTADDDSREIDIKGNSISILDGDTTPQTVDNTNFGNCNVISGTVTRIFTIENTGSLDLTLTGTPIIGISGVNASEFTITVQPEILVSSGGTTTFKVTFDPIATGIRTAAISIENDDSDENPYNFTIQGRGISQTNSGNTNTTPTPKTTTKLEKNKDGSVGIVVSNPLLDEKNESKIEVSSDDLNNAFEKAKANENGKKKVQLEIQNPQGAKGYRIELPKSVLESEKEKEIEIKTDIGTVTLPGNMFDNEEPGNSSNTSLTLREVKKEELDTFDQIDDKTKQEIGDRPVIEISRMEDGKIKGWENGNAQVKISIPYIPTQEERDNPENIVIWYIDGEGNAIKVPTGRYNPETGMVEFEVTHFSAYAIAYTEVTFNDLNNYTWAKHQIEVLAAKGITNGTGNNNYSPGEKITRADFLTLLIRTLQLKAEFENNFDDVKEADYYFEPVGIAKELGITSGNGNNRFDPKAYISREDMMVLAARALRIKGLIGGISDDSLLDSYTDKSQIAAYALESVSSLVSKEIIQGSNHLINPKGNTTRAEAAVVLYKIYNIK